MTLNKVTFMPNAFKKVIFNAKQTFKTKQIATNTKQILQTTKTKPILKIQTGLLMLAYCGFFNTQAHRRPIKRPYHIMSTDMQNNIRHTFVISELAMQLYTKIIDFIQETHYPLDALTNIYESLLPCWHNSQLVLKQIMEFAYTVCGYHNLYHIQYESEYYKLVSKDHESFYSGPNTLLAQTVNFYESVYKIGHTAYNQMEFSKEKFDEILLSQQKEFADFWKSNLKLFKSMYVKSQWFIIENIILAEGGTQLQCWKKNKSEWYKEWNKNLIKKINPIWHKTAKEKSLPGEPCFDKLPLEYRQKLKNMHLTFENVETICENLDDNWCINYTLGILFLEAIQADINCKLALKILAQSGHFFTKSNNFTNSNNYIIEYSLLRKILSKDTLKKLAKLVDMAIFYNFLNMQQDVNDKKSEILKDKLQKSGFKDQIIFKNFDQIITYCYNTKNILANCNEDNKSTINSLYHLTQLIHNPTILKELADNYQYYTRLSAPASLTTIYKKHNVSISEWALYKIVYQKCQLTQNSTLNGVMINLPIGINERVYEKGAIHSYEFMPFDLKMLKRSYDIIKYEFDALFSCLY